MNNVLKQHAEIVFQEEIEVLKAFDKKHHNFIPSNWTLSPQSVVKYIIGGVVTGSTIMCKYIGNQRLIEIAVATLTTDRALLLYGLPGTGKSLVSEHLSVAISGDSTLMIQGTSGTSEESIRYGWNYAKLLAEGPSFQALVQTPITRALQQGKIARIEELTRMPSDIQDTLITILSEKLLPIPELNTEIQGIKGFNIIATANNKDRGIHEMSSALKRRFNTVILPLPENIETEVEIVRSRVSKFAENMQLPLPQNISEKIHDIVIIFKELRDGVTVDGKMKVKTPSSTLSTAEVISVINNGLALSVYFGSGDINPHDLAAGITGCIIKDPNQDTPIWRAYLETILKNRIGATDLYKYSKELL